MGVITDAPMKGIDAEASAKGAAAEVGDGSNMKDLPREDVKKNRGDVAVNKSLISDTDTGDVGVEQAERDRVVNMNESDQIGQPVPPSPPIERLSRYLKKIAPEPFERRADQEEGGNARRDRRAPNALPNEATAHLRCHPDEEEPERRN
ncbi:hypothetical protein L596_026938 [Steinernema carpocapsae]|uniref:Uncharacterized protein n=1 Tax=Steinernema carpocapsae TaxID=34508 RepID=A0A4U5M2X0_STECR|nr:hypothetical protein L596_026938 [Steinernema carpocapsae]